MRNIAATVLLLFIGFNLLAIVSNKHTCTKERFIDPMVHYDSEIDTAHTKYRIYNRQQFKVLDTVNLWIYQYQTKVVDMVKVSAKSTKVVNKVVTDHYFSLNGGSELFQLSLSNIKLLFLFNQGYYQELCQKFKSTESLLAKSPNGTYLLNDFIKDLKNRGFKIDNQ
jgi:hypothetical protein